MPMTPAARRAAVLAAALLLGALALLLERLALPPPGLRLAEARFGETVDDERQGPRRMPHRWADDCPRCRTVWYRFTIDRGASPREAQTVWLPAAGGNAALYLDGRLLAQGGRFSEPVARLGTRSLAATLPPAALGGGPHRLDVLLKVERPRSGFVTAPALGDESDLAWPLRLREAWGRTLPQLLTLAAAMLGLMMGVIGFYRRRETAFAGLAGAALLVALQQASTLITEPPLAAPAWDAWLVASAIGAAAAVGALVLQGSGAPAWPSPRRWPWAGRAIVPTIGATATGAIAVVVGGVVAALAGLAAAFDDQGGATIVGLRLAQALLVAAGVRTLRRAWTSADGAGMAAGAALLIGPGADLLRSFGAPGALPLQPLALAVVLGLAGWQRLLHFIETLNTLEILNIDLEALVRQRTDELQTQFERVRELERRQTIATERERLMRDMHDGVGGHLVSLLAMIETGRRAPAELATAVRDALDDMRLMIDSLEPVDDDLNAVLAMWHDRLGPRLRQMEVQLHWDVELLPAVPGLTPARVLHVLRILQEAVTNAVRHGHARTLWLTAEPGDEAVTLSLRDDGSGFDAEATHGGRGLKNMQRRAAEVGAALALDSAPDRGTTVMLALPLG